jgi:hypothetical protein
VREPRDLVGKRIGVPEYQMTAPVWIRGILADEYGVAPASVRYFTGGEEQPGRVEKLKLELPPQFEVVPIGPTQTLSAMLANGEIDALYTARTPSTFYSRPDDVGRLFPDFVAAEKDYFKRTGIFPIMHVIAIRRAVYEANRWLAQSLLKAFGARRRSPTESRSDFGADHHAAVAARGGGRGSGGARNRLVAVRLRAQPRRPRHFPALPPRTGALGPAAAARGAVRAGDGRGLQDLTGAARRVSARQSAPFASMPSNEASSRCRGRGSAAPGGGSPFSNALAAATIRCRNRSTARSRLPR